MLTVMGPIMGTATIKKYQPVKPAEVFFFEGPDYSGKTTDIKMLKEHIEGYGLKVLVTQEPGGTLIGKHIRHILLDTDIAAAEEMDYLTRRLLYAASFSQGIKYIKENIDDYDYIFCDRYTPLSDMVYGYMMDETSSRSNKEKASEQINNLVLSYLYPDKDLFSSALALIEKSKLIIMSLDDSKLEERIKSRLNDGQKPDVSDIKDIDYKKAINWNYEHIIRILTDDEYMSFDREYLKEILCFKDIEVVSANNDIGTVFKDTFNILKDSILDRLKYRIR